MGESAVLVAFTQRIDDAIHNRVLALTAELDALQLDGVIDLVPAYCTLLVQFDPLILDRASLRNAISSRSKMNGATRPPGGRHHIVPVHYGGEDGPDLRTLAAARGLTERRLVEVHSSVEYKVYFLGFIPGFAYMGTVPAAIAFPRHATPRAQVAAGSVGIAGEQTGIYPFASPGGWQVLGRTSVRVWDEQRDPPALFKPGDSVRFEPRDSSAGSDVRPTMDYAPGYPVLEVTDSAPGTLVMDAGRPGFGRYGLAAGGVMDPASAIRANLLVGNDLGAAVVEMVHTGPTLRALRTTTIALDGADLGCVVSGQHVPLRTSWLVRAGTVITFRGPSSRARGFRGYLAVAGGIDVPPVLGSRSTYLAAAFGGLAGRSLRTGDILGTEPVDFAVAMAGKTWPRAVDETPVPRLLRFLPYSGPNRAPAAALAQLPAQPWRVGERSNRMGIQMLPVEVPLPTQRTTEALSFGVVRGAIQLPPDGCPFVLAADHQTTGGYPLLGVVIQADWPVIAQLAPGSEVRFVATTVDEALQALAQAQQDLKFGSSARWQALSSD